MSKHFHDPGGGRKDLLYARAEGFGPMANPRHPRKVKKKTAPSATNTEDGKRPSTTTNHY